MYKKSFSLFILLILFSACSKKTSEGEITLSSEHHFISYNNESFEKKIPTSPYGQEYTEVKISYPKLIENSDEIRSINYAISQQLLNDDEFVVGSNSSFDDLADSLFTEYKQVQLDFEDYSTAWFIHKSFTITGLYLNFVALKNEVSMYTGGANAYFNVQLSVFNLNTGKKLSLEEIIDTSKMDSFLSLAESLFLKEKDIKNDISLEDSGYWFENNQFYLPDNFNMNDSGLVFYYNLYEIAPRSEGTTELFIPTLNFINH